MKDIIDLPNREAVTSHAKDLLQSWASAYESNGVIPIKRTRFPVITELIETFGLEPGARTFGLLRDVVEEAARELNLHRMRASMARDHSGRLKIPYETRTVYLTLSPGRDNEYWING